MSTRSIARCGVCVALLACSAWVTVPLGLAPFTMQTFVLALIPQVMGPRESILTVAVYLVLGACGLPVFSGFQGGVGTLLGPTGGYLWGFLLGMAPATALMRAEALPRRAFKIVGWCFFALVCVDMFITVSAMFRYVGRNNGVEAFTAYGRWLDAVFDNVFMRRKFPSMKFQ